MKLIAKTQKGIDFFHSRKEAYFVSNASANKICEIMNNVKFRLASENEVWYSGSVVKTKIQAFYNEPISVAELGRCPR